MLVLTVIVGTGILFLLRVLSAFWVEARTQSHKPHHTKSDSKKPTVEFIPANRSARLLTFEARLRNSAIAANDAEFAEFNSRKRAF